MVAQEIERKFLLNQFPLHLCNPLWFSPPSYIEQCYIKIGEEEERYRKIADVFGGTIHYHQTLKTGTGLVRTEETKCVSYEEYASATKRLPVLRKMRHLFTIPGPDRELDLEVDVYLHEGLPRIVGEIEFASEEEAHRFRKPAWLGLEVTGDLQYLNATLWQRLLERGEGP